MAEVLVAERLKALEAKRRGEVCGLERPTATLAEFAREHLIAKAIAGHVQAGWMDRSERCLAAGRRLSRGDRDLASIDVEDIERLLHHLRTRRTKGGRAYFGGYLRHHLVTLSNLFRQAQRRKLVPPGYNPVSLLEEKPEIRRPEARWLEVHEAALYLEPARLIPKEGRLCPHVHELVATFLLTGGRADEVLGLLTEDVSFERRTIHFHATPFRQGIAARPATLTAWCRSGLSCTGSWGTIS